MQNCQRYHVVGDSNVIAIMIEQMSINQSINQYIYNALVKLLPISINNKIIRSAGVYFRLVSVERARK